MNGPWSSFPILRMLLAGLRQQVYGQHHDVVEHGRCTACPKADRPGKDRGLFVGVINAQSLFRVGGRVHAIKPDANPRTIQRNADHVPLVRAYLAFEPRQVVGSERLLAIAFDLAQDELATIKRDAIGLHLFESVFRLIDSKEEASAARLGLTGRDGDLSFQDVVSPVRISGDRLRVDCEGNGVPCWQFLRSVRGPSVGVVVFEILEEQCLGLARDITADRFGFRKRNRSAIRPKQATPRNRNFSIIP